MEIAIAFAALHLVVTSMLIGQVALSYRRIYDLDAAFWSLAGIGLSGLLIGIFLLFAHQTLAAAL